jgi:hypothetical protein
MTMLTPPDRHISRSRRIAIVASVLGVSLVVAAGAWGASRHGSQPGAANAVATPTATTAASTPTTKSKRGPTKVSPKKAGKTKASPKKAAGKTSGSTSVSGRKLPAGIVEPGRKVAAPVDVKTTSVAASVRVDLTGFRSVKSKANGPGEISAPAVRLTIRLTNTGAKSLALTSVVVNAYYGSAGTPGIQIIGDPASKPFTGSLKPGKQATAVFVFNMPVSKRGDATITVSPSPTLPIAVFAGSVA